MCARRIWNALKIKYCKSLERTHLETLPSESPAASPHQGLRVPGLSPRAASFPESPAASSQGPRAESPG
jgi:hypothetical protein